MGRHLILIKKYINLFLGILGLTYLSQELWNWFEGDSLLRIAVIGTVSVMTAELSTFLYRKYKNKKEELDEGA